MGRVGTVLGWKGRGEAREARAGRIRLTWNELGIGKVLVSHDCRLTSLRIGVGGIILYQYD